jgi:uncharacterized Zn ribbon protein
MGKKLSNKEWEEHINQYYSSNSSMTINEFCRENNLSKQQFHYHKKRILDTKDSITTVFQGLKIKAQEETSKKSTVNSEVRIIIGNATISIPVSETTLISLIIKELAI